MMKADFQTALGFECEVWELAPAPEGGVSAQDRRASDAWLARRGARFYGGCAPARALELLLDLDDRIKIGVGWADREWGKAWRRKARHRVMR
jgi:hypothetical protein